MRGVAVGEILMVRLGPKEAAVWLDPGGKRGRRIGRDLRQIRLGHAVLLGADRDHKRAIFAPFIRALPVVLRRVVSHAKMDAQQLVIAYDGRVVGDPHRFGVVGQARGDKIIARLTCSAAVIAGLDCRHPPDMAEDGLYGPETPPGKDRDGGAPWLG